MSIVMLRKQRGITMLETLLAVGISVMLFVSLTSLLAEAQRERKAATEAEQFQAFQRAAAEYFLAKRPGLLTAMEPGTNAEQDPDALCTQRDTVTINTKSRVICAVDVEHLENAGFVPRNFSPTNAFGEPLIAVFRRVKDIEDELSDNVEMLAVAMMLPDRSINPRRQATSLSAASILGAAGGVIPTHNNPGRCGLNKTDGFWACGNGWEIQLESFGLTLPAL